MVEWEEIRGEKEIWMPKVEEEEIVGVITKIDTEGKYGNTYYVQDANNFVWMLPHHSILMERLKAVTVGTVVRVIYKGKIQAKKGDTFLYKVFKHKGENLG